MGRGAELPRGAAGRDRPRRRRSTRRETSGPTWRARAEPGARGRLPSRLGAAGRLARRRPGGDGGAGGAAQLGARAASGRPARWRWSTGPTRRAPASAAACSAARRPRERWSPDEVKGLRDGEGRGHRGGACGVRRRAGARRRAPRRASSGSAPCSSCTSSRARCWSRRGSRSPRSRERSGSSAGAFRSRAAPRTPGRRRWAQRRDAGLAAAETVLLAERIAGEHDRSRDHGLAAASTRGTHRRARRSRSSWSTCATARRAR